MANEMLQPRNQSNNIITISFTPKVLLMYNSSLFVIKELYRIVMNSYFPISQMQLETEVFSIVLGFLLEGDVERLNDKLKDDQNIQGSVRRVFGRSEDVPQTQLLPSIEKSKDQIQQILLEMCLQEPTQQNISLMLPNDSLVGESGLNMSGLNGSKLGSTTRSPKFSQVVGTSVVSTIYQRPTCVLDGQQSIQNSSRQRPRSSSISQATKVTQRQELDKQTLRTKVIAAQRQLDKNLAKLEEVRKHLGQRQKTLADVKAANNQISSRTSKHSVQLQRSADETRVQAERLQFYKSRLDACKQCVHKLATQHPEYHVMIHGRDVPAQIQSLFDQLIRLSLQRIYEASKTATIKVYEQEVNLISDNEALANQINELKCKKMQLERQLRQVKDEYHKFVIKQQKSNSHAI